MVRRLPAEPTTAYVALTLTEYRVIWRTTASSHGHRRRIRARACRRTGRSSIRTVAVSALGPVDDRAGTAPTTQGGSVAVDRASTTGPCLPVADGFDLDVVARVLRHHEREVHLRPREYELLATFAANPGRAFTRRQLMDLAWNLDSGVGPRTVDVHVHWLRSKIERRPAQPAHLITVRGFGYRLDPKRR